MSKTDDQVIEPTGEPTGDPATVENNGSPATDDKDVKNLVSARDRANEELRQAQERIEDLEAVVGNSEKEKAIKDFLSQHSKDYPNVKLKDLKDATDPKEFEDLAKEAQLEADALKDELRSEIEVAKEPVPLTLDEIQAKEKAIMDDETITDKASAILELRNI